MKVIDMHCDTITRLLKENKSLYDNDDHISLLKMQKADYALQCFAMFVWSEGQQHPYQLCKDYIAHFKKEMEINKDIISQVYSYQDIVRNLNDNKMSALLTIEEGATIEGSIDNLKSFYDDGVRMMTLTWNFENEIGYPNHFNKDTGLTINKELGLKDFGREVVHWMNENGMIVDISHASDKLIYDVLQCTTKPIVASHSNARGVYHHPRSLSDDMIINLAENGGMTGINFCPNFVSADKEKDQTDDLVRHIKYITNVGGIDVCGFGTDFDGIETPVGMSDCSKMQILYDKLVEQKFTDDQIEKIFYKNFLRVFKDTCK